MDEFVRQYESAWSSRSPRAFEALWHPDGVLHHPTLDRPIAGHLVPLLTEHNLAALPDLRWVLLSWASDGNLVFMEWKCTATLGGRLLTWRGVDKMTLREGRIDEEIVYSDTLPLWQALDSSMSRGPLVDASVLEQKSTYVEGVTS